MGLMNAMFGNVSEMDAETLQNEYAILLCEGERIERAYKLIRDKWVFTNKRSFSFGLTGGLQLNYKILDNLSVYLEPGATVIPYTFKDDNMDFKKTTGVNYFDFLVHLNLGIAIYL